MRIDKLTVKDLHGYLTLELSFQPGVNLLVGINGSGKTSVLNALAWTLSPAGVLDNVTGAYRLASTRFTEIRIWYVETGKRQAKIVTARQTDEVTTFSISGIKTTLSVPTIR